MTKRNKDIEINPSFEKETGLGHTYVGYYTTVELEAKPNKENDGFDYFPKQLRLFGVPIDVKQFKDK